MIMQNVRRSFEAGISLIQYETFNCLNKQNVSCNIT